MTPLTILRTPSSERMAEFLGAVARSKELHGEWVSAPDTPEAFESYLARLDGKTQLSYWISTSRGELAGVANINEIVRGAFCSGYLGYYALEPHSRRGHMARGLSAVISNAFGAQKLHRLEANIQPNNEPSIALIKRLGFRLEGLSPRYLKLAGEWRDHERWALTMEEWVPAIYPERH